MKLIILLLLDCILNGLVRTEEVSGKESNGEIASDMNDMNERVRRLTVQLAALQQRYEASLARTTEGIAELRRKTEKAQVSRWPSGSYCIFANGACPAGFVKSAGWLSAINHYYIHGLTIKPVEFGDSYIRCNGEYCGRYGQYNGNLVIVTCCK